MKAKFFMQQSKSTHHSYNYFRIATHAAVVEMKQGKLRNGSAPVEVSQIAFELSKVDVGWKSIQKYFFLAETA